MSEDERQAWAEGTSVTAVQAERARQARLVSDGAAGARAAARRIACEWGSGVRARSARPANEGKGRREAYASDRGGSQAAERYLAHRGTATGLTGSPALDAVWYGAEGAALELGSQTTTPPLEGVSFLSRGGPAVVRARRVENERGGTLVTQILVTGS